MGNKRAHLYQRGDAQPTIKGVKMTWEELKQKAKGSCSTIIYDKVIIYHG